MRASNSRLFPPLLACVMASLLAAGCKRAAPPPPRGDRARKEHRIAPQQRAPEPREALLLQIVFDRSPAAAGGAVAVRNAACQLHLLRSRDGALRVAADIGDLRRRTVFPHDRSFQRLPAHFPFALEAPLQIALHTTVNDAQATAIPLAPKRGTLIELPDKLPQRWAFSCVLRRPGGPGVAVDGMVHGDKATILGSRALTPQGAQPLEMQRVLRQRVAH